MTSTIANLLVDPSFALATAVVADPVVPGRFHADYEDTWLSLRGVHGGYQAAVAVRVAEAMEPDRAVRTVAASFLRPGEVGPAILDVEILRRTRTFTTAIITVSQNDRPVLSVRTTSVDAVDGHDWSTPAGDLPGALETAVAFTPPMTIPHFDRAELRLDPATVPTSDAAETRIAGFIRPLEGSYLDAAWLVAAGDWFPPSPFRRVVPPIGGVSVDYTVHVHRTVTLGDDEWLAGVFETANSESGLALEHGSLTLDGLVVAETFHTRWTG